MARKFLNLEQSTNPHRWDWDEIAADDLPSPIPVASDTVTDETSFGIAPDAGVSDEYSRGDHTHGVPAVLPFIEPTTATPEDIANALIAAGLMAPS